MHALHRIPSLHLIRHMPGVIRQKGSSPSENGSLQTISFFLLALPLSEACISACPFFVLRRLWWLLVSWSNRTNDEPDELQMDGEQGMDSKCMEDRESEQMLLDAKQVCEMLGMRRSFVYDAAWRGELPSYRFGRSIRFKRADVIKFRESKRLSVSD